LRTDNCSLNRERFDFARVLISTPSLEVLNTSDQIIVDGVTLDIKIVEELGINLGDDVCLYEEDDKSESSSPDKEDFHDDFEMNNHVDILADKIAKDLATDAIVINDSNKDVNSQVEPHCTNGFQPAAVSSTGRSTNSSNSQSVDSISKVQNYTALEGIITASAKNILTSLPSPNAASAVHQKNPAAVLENNDAHLSLFNLDVCTALEGTCTASAKNTLTSLPSHNVASAVHTKNPAAVSENNDAHLSLLNLDVDNDALKKRKVRPTSSSDDVARSLQSGPWSVDWLRNVQHGDIGLISSNKKRLKKVGKGCGDNSSRSKKMASKKKAGGVLRHPVLTLKKVARLPSKDREEVMKVLRNSKVLKHLKQKIHNRRRQRERVTKSLEEVNNFSNNETSSMASVNNDWQSWVVLKGDDKTKADDINDIGKAIGLSFSGANLNKFSVLSRSKKLDVGPVLSLVRDEGGEVDGDD
jgi:hypothetical protein